MKITISVPKPCHEDWNTMHGREGGRFCDSCQHTVADLTRATDAELVALFTSDATPKCARFDPSQLGRALGAAEHPGSRPGDRQASAIPVAAFTSLLAIAGGQEALAQQGAPIRVRGLVGEVAITRPAPPPPVLKGKMMITPEGPDSAKKCSPITGDTIVVREPFQDPVLERFEVGQMSIRKEELIERVPDTVEVCGVVVDDDSGMPLPYARIWLENLMESTTTEMDGTFRFRVPVDPNERIVPLEIRVPGFRTLHRAFPLDGALQREEEPVIAVDAPNSGPADPKDPLGISGYVKDAITGKPMPGALVSLKGTGLRVRCDEQGRFFLSATEHVAGESLVVEVSDLGTGTMSIPLSANALPCCVPVNFKPEVPAPAIDNACHDLGTLRLQEHTPRYTMGVMISIEELPPPSTLQRITAPVKDAWRKLTR